jgi:hypothetical protein
MNNDKEKENAVILLKSILPNKNKFANYYYAENVKMTYSFDTLRNIVNDEFKSKIKIGDVFVFNSPTRKSCKVLMKTPKGWLILYHRWDGENGSVQEIGE